jgi:hypothetical protein
LFQFRNCLKGEVLTRVLGKKKVSRITLGSLEDLGYVVNYTAADPYGPSDIGQCRGCGRRRISGEVVPPVPLCHQGAAYENAIMQGQKMLQKVQAQYDSAVLPEGIIYIGDQSITVAYKNEDGTICSAVAAPSGKGNKNRRPLM